MFIFLRLKGKKAQLEQRRKEIEAKLAKNLGCITACAIAIGRMRIRILNDFNFFTVNHVKYSSIELEKGSLQFPDFSMVYLSFSAQEASGTGKERGAAGVNGCNVTTGIWKHRRAASTHAQILVYICIFYWFQFPILMISVQHLPTLLKQQTAFFVISLGHPTTGVATDQQDTMPMDVVNLEPPVEPSPSFSPEISTNERRQAYQQKGHKISSTAILGDELPKDEKVSIRYSGSAQEDPAEHGTEDKSNLKDEAKAGNVLGTKLGLIETYINYSSYQRVFLGSQTFLPKTLKSRVPRPIRKKRNLM